MEQVLDAAAQEALIKHIRVSRQNLVAFRWGLLTHSPGEVDPAEFHFEWSNILLKGNDNFAIEGFRESLPLDTLIPTTKGFKTINNVQVGDYVFDCSGKKTKVNYVSPVFKSLKCYRVLFDDNTLQVCSEEHIWMVYDKKKRKRRNISTKEMAEDYKGWKHKNGYYEKRFRIPICGCVDYNEKHLLVDPYILGFWLGDGTRNMAQFTIGKRDQPEIKEIFKRKGYPLLEQKSDPRGIHFSTLGLLVKLRTIGVLQDKHIPEEYLLSSRNQRLELLAGLIDSDGELAKSNTKAGTVSFTSINEHLSYNVLSLIRSLGWKATLLRKESWFAGKRYNDHYLISFKPDIKIAKLKFKDTSNNIKNKRSCSKTIKSIEEVASIPTQCIGVDNDSGTYLIGKEYNVTHNSGKGQVALRSLLLYALRFPSTSLDYIVLIKDNQDLANQKLIEIEDEYLSNPALCSGLVKIEQKSAKIFNLIVKDDKGQDHNIRIEAYGKGSSIRGLAYIDRRPKLVIIDDPQDLEDSRSDTVMDADWRWFTEDVMFLGKYTRIFLIGNNLGEKCIIERVFSNAESLRFKTKRIGILDEQGNPTWPARFPLDFIEREREAFRKTGEMDVWMRQRMCLAASEETRTFDRGDFMRYNQLYLDTHIAGHALFMTVDPASSKEPGSCYRAICVNAVSPDNRWTIIDFPYGRWQSDDFIDELFKAVERWTPFLDNKRRMPVGIEKGHFKQILEPFIYKEMQRRNIYFDIHEIEHAKLGSKLQRVQMLAPLFKAHSVWFPEVSPWLAELESELLGVTRDGFKSLFTDLVDTLAMQIQIAHAPVGSNEGLQNNEVRDFTKHPEMPSSQRLAVKPMRSPI